MISYIIEFLAAPPVSWRILTTLIEIRDNGIVALAVAVVVVGCVRGGRSRSFIPSSVVRVCQEDIRHWRHWRRRLCSIRSLLPFASNQMLNGPK